MSSRTPPSTVTVVVVSSPKIQDAYFLSVVRAVLSRVIVQWPKIHDAYFLSEQMYKVIVQSPKIHDFERQLNQLFVKMDNM